jgi:hypothetical protein
MTKRPLAMLVVSGVAIASAATLGRTPSTQSAPTSLQAARQNPVAVIDGSDLPEAISDAVAYRVFFQVIRDLNEQGNDRALRAYLRRAGIGAPTCTTCEAVTAKNSSAPEDVDVLVKQARSFAGAMERESRVLREQRLQARSAAKAGAAVQLEQRLVDDHLANLRAELSPDSAAKIDEFVLSHVKSRIKVVKPKTTR